MKATHTKTPPTFTPVTINITCETQEELNSLHATFTSGIICGSLRNIYNVESWSEITKATEEAGANLVNFNAFHHNLRRVASNWPGC